MDPRHKLKKSLGNAGAGYATWLLPRIRTHGHGSLSETLEKGGESLFLMISMRMCTADVAVNVQIQMHHDASVGQHL